MGSCAFVPLGRISSSLALKMDYSKELGVQAPLGFFDPLGLLRDADQEKFDHYRYCELKHGEKDGTFAILCGDHNLLISQGTII